MLTIAHRGASAIAPENTLLAVREALRLGANGIECDVHLCKSGEPVVIHDDTLERTTDGKGLVATQTLAQLKTLNAGRGERIPTLDEFIREIDGRAVLFIEIKTVAAAVAVADMVTGFAPQYGYEKLPVISFSWDALMAVKARDANILLGTTPPENHIPADFLARAKAGGMWSVNPCIDRLEKAFIAAAHQQGLKIITWTANTPEQIAKAKKLGVDGIISDYPDRL